MLAVSSALEPAEALALVDSPQPLLKALAAQTWTDAAAQARAVAAGWKVLEENPGDLARAGLAMARSTPDINQKLFLARAALLAMGAHDLVALTRVEGPNQEWSQAALSLAALRHLEKGAAPGPQLTLDLLREACESWAAPPWRQALFEHLTGDAALGPLARMLLADPDRLTLLSADRLLASAVAPPGPAGVAETDRAVIVGGVRVTKRGTESSPGSPVAVDNVAHAGAEVDLPLDPPPVPGRRVEVTWLEKRHRGVGAAYNPLTGQIESRDRLNRGMAAVFNPRQGEVVFQEGGLYRGVGGCYDPVRGGVHFSAATSRLRTVAVVFDPVTRTVVERPGNRNEGVAGAFEPSTGRVEFKSGRQRGFGAVVDPVTGQLVWHERRERGVVGVCNDPEYPTLAGASYAPHEEND